MKVGIILSVVIVVLLGALAAYNMLGVPDLPTAATRPEKLVKETLDPKLATFWSPANPQGNANAAYDQVLATYHANRQVLDDPNAAPPTALVTQWSLQLIDAMDAGAVTEPFFDNHIPMQVGADPDFGGALEAIDAVILQHDTKDAEHGDKRLYYKVGLAGFALGQRLFEHSVRLDNRREGVILMSDAGTLLLSVKDQAAKPDEFEKQVVAWADPLQRIRSAWEEKIPLIRSPHPNAADLVNIAQNDKDLTFRVEATLYLGVAKYNPNNTATHRAVVRTIEAAKSDPDPMVSAAAQGADALTLEDYRKLK